MNIQDMFDMNQLNGDIENGYIDVGHYHGFDIYNYTPSATYDAHWDNATVAARGLICRDNKVICKPFNKFFTIEQENNGFYLNDEEGSSHDEFNPDLSEEIIATVKWDGSLGILYRDIDGLPALSTRGRMDSEIALHFTKILRANDRMMLAANKMLDQEGYTFLFELIEKNTHVIQYDNEDIVFLGRNNNETNEWTEACLLPDYWIYYGFTYAQRLDVDTFGELLALPERDDIEGYVVKFVDTGKLVKFKYPHYMEMRRIHYFFPKLIQEKMMNDTTFREWLGYESYHSFGCWNDIELNDIQQDMVDNFVRKYLGEIHSMWNVWCGRFRNLTYLSQKEYAERVLNGKYSEYSSFLFAARKYDVMALNPFKFIKN